MRERGTCRELFRGEAVSAHVNLDKGSLCAQSGTEDVEKEIGKCDLWTCMVVAMMATECKR
eukprot:315573-Amphidinium_carterae.1